VKRWGTCVQCWVILYFSFKCFFFNFGLLTIWTLSAHFQWSYLRSVCSKTDKAHFTFFWENEKNEKFFQRLLNESHQFLPFNFKTFLDFLQYFYTIMCSFRLSIDCHQKIKKHQNGICRFLNRRSSFNSNMRIFLLPSRLPVVYRKKLSSFLKVEPGSFP